MSGSATNRSGSSIRRGGKGALGDYRGTWGKGDKSNSRFIGLIPFSPNLRKGPTMQRATGVPGIDMIRFRRPQSWTMLAFALLLAGGIIIPGYGSQAGDAAKEKAIAAL